MTAIAPPQPDTSAKHRMPLRALFAAGLGNAIEWFDWTVYATFSIYFATQIFPPGNQALALMSTFATYALAFFFRPLGGIIIGRISDMRGRKVGLVVTVSMMAGGSLVFAILPTYGQVGWLAPVLLLLARIVQGISMGGETSSAASYLAEIAPPDRRGRYSSVYYMSTGVAVLLASLLGVAATNLLTDGQLDAWGWRVPFVIGGLLGLLALWLRRNLDETEMSKKAQADAAEMRNPLRTTLRTHPRSVVHLIGFIMMPCLAYYTFYSAITPYAVKSEGADASDVFTALAIGSVFFIALQYPAGAMSDRFGRKPQLLFYCAFMAVFTVPASFLIGPGLGNMLILFVIGLSVFAINTSIVPCTMAEMFPTKLRGVGIGTWYNVTVALFGGTAPLLMTSLMSAGIGRYFFVYLAVCAVISGVIVSTMPETKGKVLD
ncbi:MFS transporter [Rhodococcus sp. ABRD24]|uniref:MFS transporter n=1 Tax=Rhodococcus sp. ABRD24 TaxID=2507582 RepID=UPI0010397282|nr:MFS transporter [Rhodococcus sp. ABRD24]QBJ95465.1 MFS transporter [Rhodococcus sp. ABRD24]